MKYRMRVSSPWALVVIYMAAIFYASSLSGVSLPRSMPDVAGHSIAYFGLALVVVRALAGGLPRRIGPGVAAAAMAITVAYGASDEIHQIFVSGRSMELRDFMADTAGAVIGTTACWVWGIIAPGVAHS